MCVIEVSTFPALNFMYGLGRARKTMREKQGRMKEGALDAHGDLFLHRGSF